MLQVQSNSRQVPSIERYTADKKYSDLLYGVLQEMSYKEGDIRYVNKDNISFSALSKRVGLTRQTVSNKFKNLIALGLIYFIEEEKRYRLNYLDKSLCSLVPFDTLRAINNTLSQNAISIFVYLLKRYIANEDQPFITTMTQMKKFIGISTATSSNNIIISDILKVLALVGLIEYNTVQVEKERTNIIISKVNNVIKTQC